MTDRATEYAEKVSPLTREAWIEIKMSYRLNPLQKMSPLTREAWIEIANKEILYKRSLVASHTRGVD